MENNCFKARVIEVLDRHVNEFDLHSVCSREPLKTLRKRMT